jgi:hypothetical protein
MLNLNFWRKPKEQNLIGAPLENNLDQPKQEAKIVVPSPKIQNTGASLVELNQKFDNLSSAVGQCFLALDKKIDTYKDNIVVIEDGISKQVEQHNEFKGQMESYENKILRLIRNLRYEIEAEIIATSDEGTKQRLGGTIEKINSSLILSLIREKGPIETAALEKEAVSRKICSKATLFRKLKVLREKGLVQKEDKDGQVFYSVSADNDAEEEYPENPVQKETSLNIQA